MLAYQIQNTAGKDEKFSWLSKTGKYTNTSNRECQNEQFDYDQQEEMAVNGSETAKISFPTEKER